MNLVSEIGKTFEYFHNIKPVQKISNSQIVNFIYNNADS